MRPEAGTCVWPRRAHRAAPHAARASAPQVAVKLKLETPLGVSEKFLANYKKASQLGGAVTEDDKQVRCRCEGRDVPGWYGVRDEPPRSAGPLQARVRTAGRPPRRSPRARPRARRRAAAVRAGLGLPAQSPRGRPAGPHTVEPSLAAREGGARERRTWEWAKCAAQMSAGRCPGSARRARVYSSAAAAAWPVASPIKPRRQRSGGRSGCSASAARYSASASPGRCSRWWCVASMRIDGRCAGCSVTASLNAATASASICAPQPP